MARLLWAGGGLAIEDNACRIAPGPGRSRPEDDVACVVAQCAARFRGDEFYHQGCFLGFLGIDTGQAVEVVDLDRGGGLCRWKGETLGPPLSRSCPGGASVCGSP